MHTAVEAWNASGARVRVFDTFYERYGSSASLNWSPSGERAIVNISTGHYLWEAASNNLIPLTMSVSEGQSANIYPPRYERSIFWDYGRGQVMVVDPVLHGFTCSASGLAFHGTPVVDVRKVAGHPT